MEHLIRLIPLIAALSFVIYMIFRMNRSMRLQKESVDRQKSGMDRIDESIKHQAESLRIQNEQSETLKAILSEIQDIKRFASEIKKSVDQRQ